MEMLIWSLLFFGLGTVFGMILFAGAQQHGAQ
jgi:hypothetical protein